jgi:hypothetical protein
MIRRVLAGAGALAVVLGGAVVVQSGVAAATKTPTTLSGTITCSMSGSLKFSPPLVNGGTASDTISVKAKLGSCSGAGASGGGVTLTGGRLAATATSTVQNSCGAVFSGSALPELAGTVKWMGSGPITSSSVDITNGDAVTDVNGDNGQGTINVSLPTSVTDGSYASQSGTTSGLTSNGSLVATDSKCGKSSGLKGLPFGKPSHTLTGSITIQSGGGQL